MRMQVPESVRSSTASSCNLTALRISPSFSPHKRLTHVIDPPTASRSSSDPSSISLQAHLQLTEQACNIILHVFAKPVPIVTSESTPNLTPSRLPRLRWAWAKHHSPSVSSRLLERRQIIFSIPWTLPTAIRP